MDLFLADFTRRRVTGLIVKIPIVGASDAAAGAADGAVDGAADTDGPVDGTADGAAEGAAEGAGVGAGVGAAVLLASRLAHARRGPHPLGEQQWRTNDRPVRLCWIGVIHISVNFFHFLLPVINFPSFLDWSPISQLD